MTIRFPTAIAAAFGLALAVMSAHADATGTAKPGAEMAPGVKQIAPVWFGAPARKPINGQPGAEMAPDVVPVDAPANDKAAGKKDPAKEKVAGNSASTKKSARKKASPKKDCPEKDRPEKGRQEEGIHANQVAPEGSNMSSQGRARPAPQVAAPHAKSRRGLPPAHRARLDQPP